MALTDFVTLGRTGLRVSPLCLGTMTFGTEWGWGSEEKASREIFDRYLEAGGNFVDTADMYTNGKSEEMLGKFIREAGVRDRVVLATKFTFNEQPRNPNAGGNGRKNIYRALEGSLKRLGTDYVDLYWLHAWDTITPVEEVISTLTDLVKSGKVRYIGLSDVPGWYVALAQANARFRSWEPIAALQLEYSLVERHIEYELVPAAQHLGIAICPWSPLASGFLAGKYKREQQVDATSGRLGVMKDSENPGFQKLTPRNFDILDVLLEVAKELGRPAAEIALNWVVTQPGVTSTLIGATKIPQLDSNLKALDFAIPAKLRKRLDEVSQLESAHPYTFSGDFFKNMISGGVPVRAWSAAANR